MTHYLKLTNDTGILFLSSVTDLRLLKAQLSLFWIEDVIGNNWIGTGKFEIGKTEVILYNKLERK